MRVLYATDGSEAAIAAGDVLIASADRAEVDVTLLSVVPTGMPAVKHLSGALRPEEDLREYAERVVAAGAARLRDAGFTVEEEIAEGRPDNVITRTAEQTGTDLLVVGAGPRSVLVGRLLGSATTALLHGSTSMLVVRDAPAARPVNVVIGTDGSAHAGRAVELAATFLDPERCGVTVVSVAVLIVATPEAPYGGYAITAPDESYEAVAGPAREHVEKAAGTLRARGFEPRTEVILGHPVKRLLGVAGDTDAALVVVGSRGLSNPDRAFLGSVSDQIVRQAPACLVAR
jgi:nucleotide-binding universal stress UspA family protein